MPNIKVTGPYAVAFDDASEPGKLKVISITFSEETIDQSRVVGREFQLVDDKTPYLDVLRKAVS